MLPENTRQNLVVDLLQSRVVLNFSRVCNLTDQINLNAANSIVNRFIVKLLIILYYFGESL